MDPSSPPTATETDGSALNSDFVGRPGLDPGTLGLKVGDLPSGLLSRVFLSWSSQAIGPLNPLAWCPFRAFE